MGRHLVTGMQSNLPLGTTVRVGEPPYEISLENYLPSRGVGRAHKSTRLEEQAKKLQ